ncbi:MAG: hypothetical protein MJA84_01905, partial [Firmicutes bacterium]|nr:hypothetical protein [Bacillota bacterium]
GVFLFLNGFLTGTKRRSAMATNDPKGLRFCALFEPDMERMVKALRILHEYRRPEGSENENNKEPKGEPKASKAGKAS